MSSHCKMYNGEEEWLKPTNDIPLGERGTAYSCCVEDMDPQLMADDADWKQHVGALPTNRG